MNISSFIARAFSLMRRTQSSATSRVIPAMSCSSLSGAPDPLACQRHMIDAHAGRVVDGVADRGRGGERAALADAFGAERPRAAAFLDDDRMKFLRQVA